MPTLVICGVCGCGKSTVGAEVARQMGSGWVFADADEYHPQANIAKMASGQPLVDEDREPWLRRLAACIEEWETQREGTVLACSALKRKYRQSLLGPNEKNGDVVVFVHLSGNRGLIAERLASRASHFMKEQMLVSQLNTLEPLEDDERGIVVDDLSRAPDRIAAEIVQRVRELLKS